MALQRPHRHPQRIPRHDLLPLLRPGRLPSCLHAPFALHRDPARLTGQIYHGSFERQFAVRGAERGLLDDGERVDLLQDFERVVQSGDYAWDGD